MPGSQPAHGDDRECTGRIFSRCTRRLSALTTSKRNSPSVIRSPRSWHPAQFGNHQSTHRIDIIDGKIAVEVLVEILDGQQRLDDIAFRAALHDHRFLVTPLIDQDQIDVQGTERLLEHVIRGGVHGIFVLGTTGEGTSLTQTLRTQFVELVCEVVSGRLPVLVGITETSITSAIQLAEQSFGAGASAVVSAAPYYLPMTQNDLVDYTEELASRLPLPLILYNMPSCTKTAFDVETVRSLSQHQNIIGVKDTSGDLDYFAQVADIAKSRPILRC